MNKVLIYIEDISPRLTYIFDLLIKDLLGLDYTLTQSVYDFTSHEGPKFCYAKASVDSAVFFESTSLLFEKDIVPLSVSFQSYHHLKGFFEVSELSAIPFDIFASAFYLVTRYEEYGNIQKDKYGRYRASHSSTYQAGFLEKPMVNYYALEIKNILQEKFPNIVFTQHQFQYIPTFDIDIAYAYLDKGIKRTLGGLVRSFFLSDLSDIKNRILVLLGSRPDPFDTYDFIIETCKTNQLSPIFFFLLADESRFDKNVSYKSVRLRKLIQRIKQSYTCGIHLSFKSHMDPEIAKIEVKRMEKIVGEKVLRNRFHYLRFTNPDSFETLLSLGLEEDYSMAYAPHSGFRSSIAWPYHFFNLRTNSVTNLRLFPTAFMDTTFKFYNQISTSEAKNKILGLMKEVKKVNGMLIGLWHNNSVSEEKEWIEWRSLFVQTAQMAGKNTGHD